MDWLTDIGALAATFALAGWLLGLLIFPGSLKASKRLWLSLALSVPATTLVALPGLLLRQLTPATLAMSFGVLLLVTGGRLYIAGEDYRWPRFRALATPARVVGLVAAVLVVWFAVVAPQVDARSSPWPSGLSLYYWQMVQATVDGAYFPATIQEWGGARPFPFEYLVTTVHGAVTALVAGEADLGLQERYRVAVLVLALAASFAAFNRWLPAWWALVAATLAVTGSYLLPKLSAYRPEMFGLVLVLWAAWLLDEACVRRSWRWAALAGGLAGFAFLSHGTVWLIAAPLGLAILIGRFVDADRLRPPTFRLRQAMRAVLRSTPPRLAVVGLAAFLLTIGTVSLGTGTAGRFAGVFTVSGDEVPTEVGADPTWELFYAATYEPTGMQPSPPDLCGRPFNVRTVRLPWDRFDVLGSTAQGVIGLAALSILIFPLGGGWPGRRLLLGGLVVVVTTYAVTESLCLAYDNYVPSRAGPTRILPYYVLGLAMLVAGFGWLVSARMTRAVGRGRAGGGNRLLWRSGVSLLVPGLVSAAILLPLTPLAGSDRENAAPGGVSAVAGEAFVWMSERLPPDAVVMANAFTEGSVGALSERTGWLDGRAPYLESAAWRADAARWLREARAYFSDPAKHRRRLPREVDYVLVAGTGVNIGGHQFTTDYEALRREPNLRLVRNFKESQLVLYRVDRRSQAPATQSARSTSRKRT